ncbi:hypothetical protein SCLCIDRAFT_32757 [Scleroderma citrinum Foug A]|uniref:Uncharacterized protein n=1 Tax=Scleroderma citrinum Foug A TaxID=1036808 RepID=A0A0C3CUQ1_9AGAM|nr:hypothetical protein SCLCIDRAFT_32757 [Scleroderma citrinum Foug A]
MPTSKSQDVSLALTLAASVTDPPTTPSGVETSGMTDGDMLEDQHDNARMKVELEQNQEELEPLQALVEAIWEQQFLTTPALCDPLVPPPQSGLGHTIPSVPTSVHPSPPPALFYHGPMSPSIQALLAPHHPLLSVLFRGWMQMKPASNTTDKPDDTLVMDQSLVPIDTGLVPDGPPSDPASSTVRGS